SAGKNKFVHSFLRTGMSRPVLSLLVLAWALNHAPVFAQHPAPGTRDGKIVVWSPHFDGPPFTSKQFNCREAPLYLVGFEATGQFGPSGHLAIRTMSFPRSPTGPVKIPLAGALVRLTRRVDDMAADSLPSTPPW